MSGFFASLKSGLTKSSKALGDSLSFLGGKKLSASQLGELEEALILADLGVATAAKIVENLRARRDLADLDEPALREALAAEISALLAPAQKTFHLPDARPAVILMTGVNGAGKTTTIGKLAQKFIAEGKTVMLAAGDTFRAAAGEQLQIWGERAGVGVVSGAFVGFATRSTTRWRNSSSHRPVASAYARQSTRQTHVTLGARAFQTH